ncbi:MAG: hypothetical protein ACYCQJ_12705 [Nitrososphaerales archaeon]
MEEPLQSLEITWTHPFLGFLCNRAPKNIESILDVGIGYGIVGYILKRMTGAKLEGIEIFDAYAFDPVNQRIYDKIRHADVLEALEEIRSKSIDLIICTDYAELRAKQAAAKANYER